MAWKPTGSPTVRQQRDLEGLATGGQFSRRSIQILRMVLRAALADAVDIGELRRSPAARVGMPRQVAKPSRQREAEAWTEDEMHRFLTAISGHRWEAPLRLAVLYGFRRSELLGLHWSAVDLKKRTVRIEHALVEVHGRPEWSEGKNSRSRRTIPIDSAIAKALTAHRRFQTEERLAAGPSWTEQDLVVATRHGNVVSPGNFGQTLDRLVSAAGVPRLTSHGLRHTAATHMVRHAADIGEIRAAADLLGHSPDLLFASRKWSARRSLVDDSSPFRGARNRHRTTSPEPRQWLPGLEAAGGAFEDMVSEGHDQQDLPRRVVILREATADDGSVLESFDLGDTSSPWLAEVAEIVSGLLAWQRDKEPVDLDRRVVVVELDDEIVAVAAHLQLIDMQGKAYPEHRYLMVVAVLADQRRRGVALFLVESVLADLRRRDVRPARHLHRVHLHRRRLPLTHNTAAPRSTERARRIRAFRAADLKSAARRVGS